MFFSKCIISWYIIFIYFIYWFYRKTNGDVLVITCEGNCGFYETGIISTPMSKGYSILGWNHPGFGSSTVSILFILKFIIFFTLIFWWEELLLLYCIISNCKDEIFGNVAVNINHVCKLNVIEVMARLLLQSNYD